MGKQTFISGVIGYFLLLSTPAWSTWWVGADSQVQFVSIKQNNIGEISRFDTITGSVTDEGYVDIRVALDSVETRVDIRNERMKTLLFEVGAYPEASITGQLDMPTLAMVAAGRAGSVSLLLNIDLHGASVQKQAAVLVTPTDVGVTVITLEPILLTAAEFGLEAGVAALQNIAGLSAISRVIPVTINLHLLGERNESILDS